jgi:glucose/mannose transport system substrate-binding protein
MGDWTYGELAKAGLKENQDFGLVSSPGTEGAFLAVADGFTLAKGAPHLAEASGMARNGGQQRGAGSLQCAERFHPGTHRRGQGPIRRLPAVVDGLV